jgi:hypothetical protein
VKKPIPNTKKEPLETITIKGASVAIYLTPSKKSGREYPGHRQTFGSNAVSAQVSGDTVVVQTSKGRTEEYVNGSIRRTY